MSRKYMIDRWCVRCGKTEPSPFTKRCLARIMTHLSLLGEASQNMMVVDIGCGNGRNAERFRKCGFGVRAFDMNPDYKGAEKIVLGKDKFPLPNKSADIVLANYVLMFLDPIEFACTMAKVKNILKDDGMFIWELYPAKDSFFPNERVLALLQHNLEIIMGQVFGLRHKIFCTKDKGFYSGVQLFK